MVVHIARVEPGSTVAIFGAGGNGLKETAEQSFACLRPGGTAMIVGMAPIGRKIELHGFDFLRERRIQGSMMGSHRVCTGLPRLIECYH
jgi:S-(hydroxymethyl)glutathione dehydrogenase/alcohol dehydrogenase